MVDGTDEQGNDMPKHPPYDNDLHWIWGGPSDPPTDETGWEGGAFVPRKPKPDAGAPAMALAAPLG